MSIYLLKYWPVKTNSSLCLYCFKILSESWKVWGTDTPHRRKHSFHKKSFKIREYFDAIENEIVLKPKGFSISLMGLYHPLDGDTNLKYKLLGFLTPNKKKFKEKGISF